MTFPGKKQVEEGFRQLLARGWNGELVDFIVCCPLERCEPENVHAVTTCAICGIKCGLHGSTLEVVAETGAKTLCLQCMTDQIQTDLGMTTEFKDIAARYERIAVAGVPSAGKSTMVLGVRDRPVLQTDSLRTLPWGEIPGEILRWCRERTRWVVEGVQVARALRRGLWCDAVCWLDLPLETLDARQRGIAKTAHGIFSEWLVDRGGHPDRRPDVYLLQDRLGEEPQFQLALPGATARCELNVRRRVVNGLHGEPPADSPGKGGDT